MMYNNPDDDYLFLKDASLLLMNEIVAIELFKLEESCGRIHSAYSDLYNFWSKMDHIQVYPCRAKSELVIFLAHISKNEYELLLYLSKMDKYVEKVDNIEQNYFVKEMYFVMAKYISLKFKDNLDYWIYEVICLYYAYLTTETPENTTIISEKRAEVIRVDIGVKLGEFSERVGVESFFIKVS